MQDKEIGYFLWTLSKVSWPTLKLIFFLPGAAFSKSPLKKSPRQYSHGGYFCDDGG